MPSSAASPAANPITGIMRPAWNWQSSPETKPAQVPRLATRWPQSAKNGSQRLPRGIYGLFEKLGSDATRVWPGPERLSKLSKQLLPVNDANHAYMSYRNKTYVSFDNGMRTTLPDRLAGETIR